jgi:hypothetical protein
MEPARDPRAGRDAPERGRMSRRQGRARNEGNANSIDSTHYHDVYTKDGRERHAGFSKRTSEPGRLPLNTGGFNSTVDDSRRDAFPCWVPASFRLNCDTNVLSRMYLVFGTGRFSLAKDAPGRGPAERPGALVLRCTAARCGTAVLHVQECANAAVLILCNAGCVTRALVPGRDACARAARRERWMSCSAAVGFRPAGAVFDTPV